MRRNHRGQRILGVSPAFLSPGPCRPPALTKAQPGRASEGSRINPVDLGDARRTRHLPEVPVIGNRHEGEEPRRRLVLAVHELRRDMERVAKRAGSTSDEPLAMTSGDAVRELVELIAALDRRVPRVERAGEASIARDAAALKARALQRIEELEREPARSEGM